jgi:hypothetical protein
MPATRINCPNCRQPISAEIQQVFDLNEDPAAKQTLLSGMYNVVQCPHCGYQGNVATPIVYHDPDKELLLTFVPAEIGLPRDEQERVIGNLINQIVNRLPQEKRKGYLLRPQSTLTMQGLVERILEEDGITREMIQAQQKKISLIERLLGASEESRAEIAKEEDEQIDAEFFTILSRLAEAALAGGDENSARQLAELQRSLLENTSFGREVKEQSDEVEAAAQSLRDLGREVTREKLLDLILKAPTELRMRALVSLARPALDYEFFQLLSQRIDRARGDGRTRLAQIREQILEWTAEIDKQMEVRVEQTRQLLDRILAAGDVESAMAQSLGAVDDVFLAEVDSAMEAARKSGDLDQISKIQRVINVIEKASAPPPELAFIEDLLDTGDETERYKILAENPEKVTPELLNTLTNIVAQTEGGSEPELTEQVKALHRQVLRFSMQANLNN